MRWWKVLGLAGIAGVAATGAVIARSERRRRAYAPEEIRARLHARLDEAASDAASSREARDATAATAATAESDSDRVAPDATGVPTDWASGRATPAHPAGATPDGTDLTAALPGTGPAGDGVGDPTAGPAGPEDHTG